MEQLLWYLRKLWVIVTLKNLKYFERFALSAFCGYVQQGLRDNWEGALNTSP